MAEDREESLKPKKDPNLNPSLNNSNGLNLDWLTDLNAAGELHDPKAKPQPGVSFTPASPSKDTQKDIIASNFRPLTPQAPSKN